MTRGRSSAQESVEKEGRQLDVEWGQHECSRDAFLGVVHPGPLPPTPQHIQEDQYSHYVVSVPVKSSTLAQLSTKTIPSSERVTVRIIPDFLFCSPSLFIYPR